MHESTSGRLHHVYQGESHTSQLTAHGPPSLPPSPQVDPDKQSNLSKDGTVHELTSSVSLCFVLHFSSHCENDCVCVCVQTLWFLENLLEYSRIVGEVFLGEGSFAARSSDQERRKALGQYLGA